MSAKKRGLGRGLNSLLSSSGVARENQGSPQSSEERNEEKNPKSSEQLRHIPIEFITPGKYQPRLDMRPEALEELADSIRAQGLMQPIVVRQVGNEKYEIIAGERRWRACQLVGLDKISVVIRNVEDDAAIAMALIENIQRENLNPMEEAIALKRLQDEFELTQQEVAEAVGKSRSTVTNLLRLMGLVPEVRTFLEHGDIEMGHARAILGVKDEAQVEMARAVIGKGLNVRQTEALARQKQSAKVKTPVKTKEDPDVRLLQDSLSEKLGAAVLIQHSAKGKGKLILKYNSLDELDGILSHIN